MHVRSRCFMHDSPRYSVGSGAGYCMQASPCDTHCSPLQVDDPNPHGISHAWTYLARCLNTLPADRYTAKALIAVLRVAGYSLFVRWGARPRLSKPVWVRGLSSLAARTCSTNAWGGTRWTGGHIDPGAPSSGKGLNKLGPAFNRVRAELAHKTFSMAGAQSGRWESCAA